MSLALSAGGGAGLELGRCPSPADAAHPRAGAPSAALYRGGAGPLWRGGGSRWGGTGLDEVALGTDGLTQGLTDRSTAQPRTPNPGRAGGTGRLGGLRERWQTASDGGWVQSRAKGRDFPRRT